MRIGFVVFGTPQPQGSARAFLSKDGRRPIITSDNARLKPWRQELAWVAVDAMQKGQQQKAPRGVPISVRLAFYFEKPKSARKSAHWKITKPDLDKLLRAVLDALTGIAYEDDSQVCECQLGKAFGAPARVEVLISTVEDVPKTPLAAVPQRADSAREPAPGLPFGAGDSHAGGDDV
jgi:crossover junction endodeoxyribonuclease RusA